ncbi:uncharacterized protein LOC118646705 [Monomorium pharaonis]|uniref:uncharacterized protein LOC118646705 n=1 Tax=Monomorium pharaonis TaxID=307658 RepID=UPI0017465475|nr:uncharacterized protein LOC118646705 [Monomorium pharaonis]
MLSVGQIDLSRDDNDLCLQKTRLGWIISGSTTTHKPSKFSSCHLVNLEELLTRFWAIEGSNDDKPRSKEEAECEARFVDSVTRDESGRYTVRLPFRKSDQNLGNSRPGASKRLIALERRLNADAALNTEYTRIFEEYLELGHMSPITNTNDDGYYMPHHPVIKGSSHTTKVRIVFDASATTSSGLSLNDMLMVGPTIQDKLFTHLIRFRSYKYVVTADIEKMYRQVLVHENDRRYQRVLWRRGGKIETFQLNTLTFGVSSSPFLAIRTIQKFAEDERASFPKAAEILKSHLYVDDLLTGANSIDECRNIRDQIIALLAAGGFSIRQWASNDARIINDLDTRAQHANFIFKIDSALKTLGISWNTREDKICYCAKPIEVAEKLTKRKLLSEIAKIFDPLGLLGPVILHTKRIMQDIWRSGLDWDESVPQSMHTEWQEFARQFDAINQFAVDRNLVIDENCGYQIHGFCDASNVGYGAAIYIRSEDRRGQVAVRLLCAKSRVAPLKTTTIPRLELCGALLLAQLVQEIPRAFSRAPNKIALWCDSTIVLHWIKTPSNVLKTFVANRVAEIQILTDAGDWRHIRSENNPADALSRGQLPHNFMRNKTWLTGPSWLIEREHKWPCIAMRLIEIPEVKQNSCLATIVYDETILRAYSSYAKLLRIVAYCCRFLHSQKYSGPLCVEEIEAAETRVLRLLQSIGLPNEFKHVKNKAPESRRHKIDRLNPFIDGNGLIRVGGRISLSDASFDQRHPILLPSYHPVTDNIIRETHAKHYHAGIQMTLHLIR